ncbi:MAG: hypothetical protein WBQ20_04780 [Methyloceanibacter sp.]
MNQREIVVAPAGLGKPRSWYRVSSLIATLAGLLTTALVYLLRAPLFADLHNYPLTLFVFLWFFGVMLACAFSVVRHADAAACRLGEPYGTLVLTISVIIIEVSLMAAIIWHGENNPTLARDAMFATLMIVLKRPALLGAGIQSRRSAFFSGGHRLARSVRADHAGPYQDRA